MTTAHGIVDKWEPEHEAGGELLFPCSSSQERCWFIYTLDPGTPALNIALRWEIRGQFSPSTVEQAFQTIIDRHEILRTRFVEKNGEPIQEVISHYSFKLSVVDLTIIPEAKRLDEALELGRREAHVQFDIGQLPLIRVTLVRLAADRAYLLLTIHQIVFDGMSIRVLADELGVIAAALDARRPHNLPEPLLQYGDYCRWQKEYFASGNLAFETTYWKSKLAGAPYFEVVPDHARPARPTHRGEILAAMLPVELGDRLEEAARKQNMTFFSLGCAVMAAMLHRYTGKTDVIFGTQIAGRDEQDLENMIGIFINNLVLRFDASGDPAFAEFLTRVNETVQDALIHQRMPFHKLVEVLNPPRDPTRTPLISINFAILNDVREEKRYGDFVLLRQPSHSTGSLYDLNFFLLRWPTGWRMALEFNIDLFERSTAERMLESLVSTFEFAVSNPGSRLSALSAPAREAIDHAESHVGNTTPAPSPTLSNSVPPTDVEARLMAIWRDVLQVQEISPSSNFFELGGHSLLAMRLVTRVASTFGTKIGVMMLFQAPTVREFAARLSQNETPLEPWNIVQIQPLGEKTPIIAINNTMMYFNLAKTIGTDRPFLGIQLFNPSVPKPLVPRSLSDIASDYVKLIRESQPHGPYILCGICISGSIAYEAAQQLRQAGESVPLLVLSDIWAPGYIEHLPFVPNFLLKWSYRVHMLKYRFGLILRGKASVAEVLASYELIRESGILDLAAKLRLINPASLANLQEGNWGNLWFLRHLEEARNRYQASACVGDVVVFQSDEIPTHFANQPMGWHDFVQGRLFVHKIPGWHGNMFHGEGAVLISEYLRPLLEQADAERDRFGPTKQDPP